MKKAILYVLLFVAIQVVVMTVVEGVCLLIGSTAVVVDKTTQMIIGLSAANVLALVVSCASASARSTCKASL